jgi:D-amino-acid dehydrogenase
MGRVGSVAVVGAGMVGLATAWHLQEHGVEVTVVDRTGVAGGASWGNAGWVTPTLVTPLPDPTLLRHGVRALLSSRSPVYAPLAADRDLHRFLTGFLRHSTHPRWRRSMRALLPLARQSLDEFDRLAREGVSAPLMRADPIVAAFPKAAQVAALTTELEQIAAAGSRADYELVSGAVARRLAPVLSGSVEAAVLIRGQRFLNPVTYVHTLANDVLSRGGTITTGSEVVGIHSDSGGVRLAAAAGGGGAAPPSLDRRFDAVVVATGAWLGRLARGFGVRQVVQAGRGYSFSVQTESPLRVPVYLPTARVAMTPFGGRLRIAGMMELRRADAAFDPRRVSAIVESVRPLVEGVDLDSRSEEWVGPRPLTIDGLPLIGATASPRVFVAGGHGMWGLTLGPVTGRLLAEQVVTGRVPEALGPFDPLR